MKEFKTLGPTQFGIGDGSQTRFSVARQGDVISSAHVESVITVGWQGEQLLSPTPRTNLLLASNDFESLAWRGSPSLYADFSLGPPLDPRVTFSRSTPAWYWQNGILVEAGIDEPVFENGALRLEPQATNLIEDTLQTVSGTSLGGELLEDSSGNFVRLSTLTQGRALRFSHISPSFTIANAGEIFSYHITYRLPPEAAGFSFIHIGRDDAQGPNRYFLNLDLVSGGVVNARSGGNFAILEYSHHNITEEIHIASMVVRAEVDGAGVTPTLRVSTSDAPIGTPAIDIYNIQLEKGRAISSSPIPTNGSPVTRAADRFSLTGEAFQRVFNPNEGALVFKIGEGSAAPKVILGPLEFDNMQSGETLALAWHNDEFKVFRDGAADGTFTQDMTGADELKFESMYLKSLSLYTTRPTDAEMEALTSA